MLSLTTFPELDTGLRIAGLIVAALFAFYVFVFFIRTTWYDGILAAIIRAFSFHVTIPLLIVLAVNLLVFSLVFVRPNEAGVVISFPSPGGVRPQPLLGGFHLILPFVERVRKYPTSWQTYTMSSAYNEGNKPGDDSIRARTSDGQEVRLDCSLIFRIDAQQAVLVHIDWQDRYVNELIRPVTRGIVRRQVSRFTVEEVNSSLRRTLESDLDNLLREEFAGKGFILDQFLLRDITFSSEYAMAIENKQVALEDQIRAEYEAERMRRLARGRADAVLIEAEARAKALVLIAGALDKNENLLTYRYIEKLSPNIRAMLLPNNAPFILPLDQMLRATDSLTATSGITATDAFTDTIVPETIPEVAP